MGRLDPILYNRYGAVDDAGSGSDPDQLGLGSGIFLIMRHTPSTISSIYVKSLVILPWLYKSIGSEARIDFVKRK